MELKSGQLSWHKVRVPGPGFEPIWGPENCQIWDPAKCKIWVIESAFLSSMILPEWLLHFFIDIGDLGAWSKMIQLRVHKVQVKGTESQKLRV